MWYQALILAQSGDELIYIIAVFVLVGLSFGANWLKAKMAELKRPQGPAGRPKYRPPVPPTRRPPIPPLREADERPGRARSSFPPAVPRPTMSRPQPPARPPVAAPQARRGDRPSPERPGPPAGGRVGRPIGERTLEERGTVIRGESPPPMVPGAPTIEEEPAWRLLVPRESAAPETLRSPPAVPAPAARDDANTSGSPLTTLAGGIESLAGSTPAKAGFARRAASRGGRRSAETPSLRGLSVADLQRALILKEMLDPPLALRDV
ncbi:MAG: hypothetical protein HY718_18620 [Planctomycetes bacterium]|nr:hypothetical protein [Planctomycetota bacterium]